MHRAQLPTLTSLSNGAVLPPPGSLVRFRAMVQDTGLGSELYRAAGSEGQPYMYGAEEQASGGSVRSVFLVLGTKCRANQG